IRGYDVNVKGTENLINVVKEYASIKRVIFASSMLVCKLGYNPNNKCDYMPSTLYGESKVLGEKLVYENDAMLPEWVIVRPTSIWGPWFGDPYYKFFDMVIKRKYVSLGKYAATKTFGYIKNAVFQMDKLLFEESRKVEKRMFYLGDYSPLNISVWSDNITEVLKEKPAKRVPMFIFRMAALVGDMLRMLNFKKFPMNSFRLKNMTKDNIINLRDIKQIVPALPCSLEEGIQETLEWMKESAAKV
ncbi:MAG: NAD(P)-dependent oxidoreductase, partial [Candidatus Omnitrophica bacterium]|nr:NAD(P)-dependent oxidoreductase [Candidatus Omnitrophota bacterium]